MIDLLLRYSAASVNLRHRPPARTAPEFVRTRLATRWHRARSGSVHDDGSRSYQYWCGAGGHHVIGVEQLPPGDELCATCEGRWLAQQDRILRFDPLSSLRPRWCPLSQRRDPQWWPGRARHIACPACGEDIRLRASSGYCGGARVEKHEAGRGLVAPCQHHGWHHITVHDGRAVCACTLVGVA